uniref:PX domain-containing protein n=1 Tax=Toxoplasma gondii (strain ATCC 50861 / VEG) TaxID=432359 RepID=A0A0F7UVN9_TOXGV|nr:TPA: PX domain-containing protein [Toxoplasma gondii VEG]
MESSDSQAGPGLCGPQRGGDSSREAFQAGEYAWESEEVKENGSEMQKNEDPCRKSSHPTDYSSATEPPFSPGVPCAKEYPSSLSSSLPASSLPASSSLISSPLFSSSASSWRDSLSSLVPVTVAGTSVGPVTDLCVEAMGFEVCRGNGEFYLEFFFRLNHACFADSSRPCCHPHSPAPIASHSAPETANRVAASLALPAQFRPLPHSSQSLRSQGVTSHNSCVPLSFPPRLADIKAGGALSGQPESSSVPVFHQELEMAVLPSSETTSKEAGPSEKRLLRSEAPNGAPDRDRNELLFPFRARRHTPRRSSVTPNFRMEAKSQANDGNKAAQQTREGEDRRDEDLRREASEAREGEEAAVIRGLRGRDREERDERRASNSTGRKRGEGESVMKVNNPGDLRGGREEDELYPEREDDAEMFPGRRETEVMLQGTRESGGLGFRTEEGARKQPPPINLRRRYRAFAALHVYLVSLYPRIPPFPPKLPLLPLLTPHLQSLAPPPNLHTAAASSDNLEGAARSSSSSGLSPCSSLGLESSSLPWFSVLPPQVTPPLRRRWSTSSTRLAFQLVQQRQRQLLEYVSALLRRPDVMGDRQVLAFFNLLPSYKTETPVSSGSHGAVCPVCASCLGRMHPLRPLLLLQFRGARRATFGVLARLSPSGCLRGEGKVATGRRSGFSGEAKCDSVFDRKKNSEGASRNEKADSAPGILFVFLLHRTASSFFSRVVSGLQRRASASLSPLRLQEQLLGAAAVGDSAGVCGSRAEQQPGGSAARKLLFQEAGAHYFKRVSLVTATFNPLRFCGSRLSPSPVSPQSCLSPFRRAPNLFGSPTGVGGGLEAETSSEGTSVASEVEHEGSFVSLGTRRLGDSGGHRGASYASPRTAVRSEQDARQILETVHSSPLDEGVSPPQGADLEVSVRLGEKRSTRRMHPEPASYPLEGKTTCLPLPAPLTSSSSSFSSYSSSSCSSSSSSSGTDGCVWPWAFGPSLPDCGRSGAVASPWGSLPPKQQSLLNEFRKFHQERAGYLPGRASSCCFSSSLRLLLIGLATGGIICGAVFPPPSLCSESSSCSPAASSHLPSSSTSSRLPLSPSPPVVSSSERRFCDETAEARDPGEQHRRREPSAAVVEGRSSEEPERAERPAGSRKPVASRSCARVSLSASSIPFKILPSASFLQTPQRSGDDTDAQKEHWAPSRRLTVSDVSTASATGGDRADRGPAECSAHPAVHTLRAETVGRVAGGLRKRGEAGVCESPPVCFLSSSMEEGAQNLNYQELHCTQHERETESGAGVQTPGGRSEAPASAASCCAGVCTHPWTPTTLPVFQPHRGSVTVLLTVEAPVLDKVDETVTLLVSAARDRQVYVHVASTGRLLLRQEIPAVGAPRVGRADDALRLLFLGCDDGSICVYRLALLSPSKSGVAGAGEAGNLSSSLPGAAASRTLGTEELNSGNGAQMPPAKVSFGSAEKPRNMTDLSQDKEAYRVRLVVAAVARGTLSGSPDGRTHASPSLFSPLKDRGADASKVCAAPQGQQVAEGLSSRLSALYSLPRLGAQEETPSQTSTFCRKIEAMCLAPERQLLFTATTEGWIHVWRYHTEPPAGSFDDPFSRSTTRPSDGDSDAATNANRTGPPIPCAARISASFSSTASTSTPQRSPLYRGYVELQSRSSPPCSDGPNAPRGVSSRPEEHNERLATAGAAAGPQVAHTPVSQQQNDEETSGETTDGVHAVWRRTQGVSSQEGSIRLELLGRLECIAAGMRVGALAWWPSGSVLAVASVEKKRKFLHPRLPRGMGNRERTAGKGGVISFVALGGGSRKSPQDCGGPLPLSDVWRQAHWVFREKPLGGSDQGNCGAGGRAESQSHTAAEETEARGRLGGRREDRTRETGIHGGMVCVWRAHAESIVDLWMLEEEAMMSVDRTGAIKLWLLPPVC